MRDLAPMARFGGLVASDLRDVTADPAALDSAGFWAVAVDFEGRTVCARFGDVRPDPHDPAATGARAARWHGPDRTAWTSSMDRQAYEDGVRTIRERIAAGDVYQVNLCRVLGAPLPAGPHQGRGPDIDALGAVLALGNPAPYAGTIRLPGHGVEIATASPELFLSRDGRTVESRPIKGTARTADSFLPKDDAENIMIVDLVRNDLGRVCTSGSVTVPALCAVEPHPGLVHLVSTVRGELRTGAGWPELLAATFPPGSVTGAPKSSALRIIGELETAPRGPYCGGIGWVDADRGTGALAVGIRTFWIDRGTAGHPELRFGTGAGITWGSDPAGEWAETELKAERLLAVASEVHEARGRTLR
ncbi:chorismate-binding protein [Actinacidiphila bryophytorum]|uniref:Para-aminobenzoate synthase, aminase component n=1 Tax=Actinacidiphila bryophytorum TaxID=1436133 RepID=A0A9W4MGV2_9ACTN|nr:chorismate-binding protein [Actinacidiphila bryophytorum]MBM9439475.1 chorismate-binding protein [Actinacidiphila bryophytorum]MBN6546270.1 chorismate-binding protein [Actinacidiphila bryophytorum]CAG7655122.1 Para-aminobenzoate synthase, aminase component [Actinacidiphila bryophytorum]